MLGVSSVGVGVSVKVRVSVRVRVKVRVPSEQGTIGTVVALPWLGLGLVLGLG